MSWDSEQQRPSICGFVFLFNLWPLKRLSTLLGKAVEWIYTDSHTIQEAKRALKTERKVFF